MGTGGRVIEDDPQALLHLVGDYVFPPACLDVSLLPRQTNDVSEQTLRQAVFAHHTLGQFATLRSEGDLAAGDTDIPIGVKALHHLPHRGGRIAQPLGQAGLDDGDPILSQLVDGGEVLLYGWVEAVGHAGIVAAERSYRPSGLGGRPGYRPSNWRAVPSMEMNI